LRAGRFIDKKFDRDGKVRGRFGWGYAIFSAGFIFNAFANGFWVDETI